MDVDFLKYYLLHTTYKEPAKYKLAKKIEKKVLNIEACIHALFKDKDISNYRDVEFLEDNTIFNRLEAILKYYKTERRKLLRKLKQNERRKSDKKVKKSSN